MNSMLLVEELILAVFLEKKTRKNSKNSSLPSSQKPKDETAKSNPNHNPKSKSNGKKIRGEVNNIRTKGTVTIPFDNQSNGCS